jgi:hypothetical protein
VYDYTVSHFGNLVYLLFVSKCVIAFADAKAVMLNSLLQITAGTRTAQLRWGRTLMPHATGATHHPTDHCHERARVRLALAIVPDDALN